MFSTLFGSIIVALSIPLFIDLLFLLSHRVHPRALSPLIENEIRVFTGKYEDKMREKVEWNMWSLDKSYRVFSCKISMNDLASKDPDL